MHVLIIPDGNRRWAKKRGLRRPWEGHRQGAETFKEILKEALNFGIRYVTIWSSTPNNLTQRSKQEVAILHKVLRRAFRELAASEEVHTKQARIRAIGRWQDPSLCPPSLQTAIAKCMQGTADYDDYHLTILVAYSGIEEMEDAIRRMVADSFFLRGCEIDREVIRSYLWTAQLPDVDLIIRTGVEGDPHNSESAMMWHTADSQYYFTETHWPDFTAEEFRGAIEDFKRRPRRYGK